MKKPTIVMLKKGSRIRVGDISVRTDRVTVVELGSMTYGKYVHGPDSSYMTEGYYFRVVWK